MKNRLIELLQDIDHYPEKTCPKYGTGEECGDCQYKLDNEKGCDLYARKADYMIAKGVFYPPCKVGDAVYQVQTIRKRVQAYTITAVKYNGRFWFFSWVLKDRKGFYENVEGFSNIQIGKTVFLTKEEAEIKLKEGVKNER